MNVPPTAALPIADCLHCGGHLEPRYVEIDEEYECALACFSCGAVGPTGSGETMEDALDDATNLYGSTDKYEGEPA